MTLFTHAPWPYDIYDRALKATKYAIGNNFSSPIEECINCYFSALVSTLITSV